MVSEAPEPNEADSLATSPTKKKNNVVEFFIGDPTPTRPHGDGTANDTRRRSRLTIIRKTQSQPDAKLLTTVSDALGHQAGDIQSRGIHEKETAEALRVEYYSLESTADEKEPHMEKIIPVHADGLCM